MNASIHIIVASLSLLLLTALGAACASLNLKNDDPYGGGPPEGVRCSEGVTFADDAPADAYWAVDRACARFSEKFDVTVEVLATVLEDLEIHLIRFGQFDQCAERGRSCTSRKRAEINMESFYWRALIMHEVTHVLILYFEPDLPHHNHHSYMQSHGICYRGCTPAPLFQIAAGYH